MKKKKVIIVDYEKEMSKIRNDISQLTNMMIQLEKQLDNIKERIAYLKGQYDLLEKLRESPQEDSPQ